MVLAEKPAIRETSCKLTPEVRDELLRQLSTLASVYHRVPASSCKVKRATVHRAEDLEAVRQQRSAEEGEEMVSPDGGGSSARAGGASGAAAGASAMSGMSSDTAPGAADGGMDLLGGLDDPAVRALLLAANALLSQSPEAHVGPKAEVEPSPRPSRRDACACVLHRRPRGARPAACVALGRRARALRVCVGGCVAHRRALAAGQGCSARGWRHRAAIRSNPHQHVAAQSASPGEEPLLTSAACRRMLRQRRTAAQAQAWTTF